MVGKRTRSARKKLAAKPFATENESRDDITNANPFDKETATETNDVMAETARCEAVKFKLKKKTSMVWEHYTKLLVEEEEEGMVIKKEMARCNYCHDVLCADSKNDSSRLWNHYRSFHDEEKLPNSSNKKIGVDSFDDWNYDEETSLKKYHLAITMHDYPFNYCEHEYTNDFIRSFVPKISNKEPQDC